MITFGNDKERLKDLEAKLKITDNCPICKNLEEISILQEIKEQYIFEIDILKRRILRRELDQRINDIIEKENPIKIVCSKCNGKGWINNLLGGRPCPKCAMTGKINDTRTKTKNT